MSGSRCRCRDCSRRRHQPGSVSAVPAVATSSSCSRRNWAHTSPLGPARWAIRAQSRTTVSVRSRSASAGMVSSTA